MADAITVSNLRITPYSQKDTIAKIVYGDEWSITIKLPTPHVAGDKYAIGIDYQNTLYPPNRPLCAGSDLYVLNGDELTFTLKLATARLRDWCSTLKKPMPIAIQIVRTRDGKAETLLLDSLLALPSVFDGVVTVYEGDSLDERLNEKMDNPPTEGEAGQVLGINEDGQIVWLDVAAEQVQADWDESDSESPAYIRNKPESTVVNDGKITVNQGGVKKGEFTVNQAGDTVIDLNDGAQSDWDESDSSDVSFIKNKPQLAPVATSGSYNDLENKPIITQPVNADWSESDSENLAYILNKPTIPAAQIQSDYEQSDSSAVDYIKNKPDLSVDDTDYLCFEIASVTDTDESDSSEPSFALTSVGTTSAISLEISHDKKNWAAYTVGNGLFENIAVGNKVWIRGDNATFSTDQSNYFKFVASSVSVKASGSIMSLLSKDCSKSEVPANAFSALFRGMSGLLTAPEFPATTVGEKAYCLTFRESGITEAPELPATTLARKSYSQMFQDCKALVKAPSVLPAMTLAEQCYSVMFSGCTSLLNAPELPATTLAQQCYSQMFQNCSALVKAPTSLPATTAMPNCYNQMFQGCTSLEKAPTISATTLARYCFTSMFQDCKSLVEAPALSATSLSGANFCYQNMFKGCSSLLAAPTLSAEALANGCYSMMFQDCVSLKTAPTLPATNVNFSQCYYGMFQGCTSLEKAPALPATTLGTSCYQSMFEGCTALTEMPTLSATTLAMGCYNSMFKGCTAIRETKELPATTLANYCYQHMFEDCTSLEVVNKIVATTLAAYGMQDMFKNCPSLKYIRVAFTEWHASCTTDWVANSGSTKYKGAFLCPSSLTDTRGDSNIPTGWVKTTASNTPNMNSSSGTYLWSDVTTYTICPSANDRTYRVVVADNSALTLSAVYWWDYAYAEVVLDVPTGSSVTAGSGITLVDEPEAGKRNVCVVRWADQTAKLYVVIKEDLEASSSI